MLGELLELVPRLLEYLTVLHSARTGGLARPAAQALRNMLSRIFPADLAFLGGANEIDAAARRFGLLPADHERRARLQTEAATDALRCQIGQILTLRKRALGLAHANHLAGMRIKRSPFRLR